MLLSYFFQKMTSPGFKELSILEKYRYCVNLIPKMTRTALNTGAFWEDGRELGELNLGGLAASGLSACRLLLVFLRSLAYLLFLLLYLISYNYIVLVLVSLLSELVICCLPVFLAARCSAARCFPGFSFLAAVLDLAMQIIMLTIRQSINKNYMRLVVGGRLARYVMPSKPSS